MALLLLPFFMPLFLIGWVLTPREEREQRLLATERERSVRETWGVMFGRESQVMSREDVFDDGTQW